MAKNIYFRRLIASTNISLLSMPRYFIRCAYDGTRFIGWQTQPNGKSVQAVFENCLATVLRQTIRLTGAGRTDTGVHATQYYAHFDTDQLLSSPECLALVNSLNSILPDDIAVYDIFEVGHDLHARFSAISRTYEYQIIRKKNPFLVHKAWLLRFPLDVDLMNRGAASLKNFSDFACFSKSHTQVKTTLCRVSEAYWIEEGNLLRFTITADRFLRNMVRAIVGTLVDLGRHRIALQDLERIIESGERSKAGQSVPAHGLCLTRIQYPADSGVR